MAVLIDEAEVRRIAKLGGLNLSGAEVEFFARQLGQILAYFQQLQAVCTEGVEPVAHPLSLTDVVRDDEPGVPLDRDTALCNAPERDGPFFNVPPVLDPSSGA